MMKLRFTLLIILPLLIILSTNAQMTIGSQIKPAAGAMLQLKEFAPDSNNVTARKGMLLPRVMLTDLEKLYPMFSDSDPEYQGANIAIQHATHTGVMVYHTSEDVAIHSGVYFWDGKKWKSMMPVVSEEPEPEPEDGTATDHEGNEYPTGDFGRAGWWTLQSMRATTLLDGTYIAFSNEADANDPNKETLQRIFYPNAVDNSPTRPFTYQDKYGMLYSLMAALNGESPTTGDDYVRGLCPKNWHVPTDKDWMLLEKELFDNYHLYSDNLQQSDLGTWTDYWEDVMSDGYRGKHGMVTKSIEKVEINVAGGETVVPITKGYSKAASQGGFDAYMVGVALDGKKGTQQISDLRYGTGVQFWTSNTWHSGTGHGVRKLNATENGFGRAALLGNFLVSLRCKKNAE